VSDRVAVLRAGKLVAESATAQTSQAELAQWMVGHAIAPPQRHPSEKIGSPVCEMHQVHTAPARECLKGVSLTMHRGEIFAMLGFPVMGNWH
jgi:simple sugar transport system ATP-binding protein